MKNMKRAAVLLVIMIVMLGMTIPVRAAVGEKTADAKIQDVYLSDSKGTKLTDSTGKGLGLKNVKVGETVYFTIKISDTAALQKVTAYINKQSGLSINTDTTVTTKAVQVNNTKNVSNTFYWKNDTYDSNTCYSLEITADSGLLSEITNRDNQYITICYPVEITEEITMNREVEQTVFLVTGDKTNKIVYDVGDNQPAKVRVLGFTVKVTEQEDSSVCLEKVEFTLTKNGEQVGITSCTDANGTIVFSGLDADTDYTLTQNTSKEGYAQMLNPVTVKIDENGAIFFDTSTTSADTLNIQLKAIAMPNTGNHGAVIFSITGCMFIAVAIVLSVAFKKHYLSK